VRGLLPTWLCYHYAKYRKGRERLALIQNDSGLPQGRPRRCAAHSAIGNEAPIELIDGSVAYGPR
jgi:hypothetical protein